MKKTLFLLLGLAMVASNPGIGQDSTSANPPGFGIQSSAARNKKLQDQELQAAVQKARELKALQYHTAAQPMAPIPWSPEMEGETEIERAAAASEAGPVPQAPAQASGPPPSPNSEAVEQALIEATNQTAVDLPSEGKSENLLLRMLRKKYEKIPDTPEYDAPSVTSNRAPAPSPYTSGSVEMSGTAAGSSAPQRNGGSIFLNRGGGNAAGATGSVKYETDVDVNGVDVILPQGATVSIIDERGGFARVRIPDGRIGIVHRSALE